MSRFVKGITSVEVPTPHGRVTRVTFDLDDSAVHDYIMQGQSSNSWANMVFRELVDELMEWARREDFAARLIARRSE